MTLVSDESGVDFAKALNEWALAAGRHLQSAQTGFIHYYYGETGQSIDQTIPFFENTLFCLALLRSRLMEHVQEAKTLLRRLLAFQSQEPGKSQGNFPLYLHEYPFCQDPALGLQLLAPFYWIVKHFGHVLGGDLKQSLEQAARYAIEYSVRERAIKAFPYSLSVRLAAAQLAYGTLWQETQWKQEGEEHLTVLAQKQLEGWVTTKQVADLLVGLQMVYPSLLESPWEPLWHHLSQTWHCTTGCYSGPCIREWQAGEEPQANLYDLYAGYFAGQFSRRALLMHPYHLQATLIQPCQNKFTAHSSLLIAEGYMKGQAWQMVSQPLWVYTLLEKKGASNPTMDKTYTPFRWIWGDLNFAHSLVCQGGHYERVEYMREGQTIQLIFSLSAESLSEERVKPREIEFFVNFHPDVRFKVDDCVATTFELGQTLHLFLGSHRLSFVFSLLEGEGDFLGHIMRGNRPSQVNHKGEKRFHSYDWAFFLRTVRRSGSCRVRVTISYEGSE